MYSKLLTFRGPIGAQPQRDVGGLQGLLHHSHELVIQCVEKGSSRSEGDGSSKRAKASSPNDLGPICHPAARR